MHQKSKIKTAGTNTSREKTWQRPKLPTETCLSYLLPALILLLFLFFGQQRQQPKTKVKTTNDQRRRPTTRFIIFRRRGKRS
jgi:hypothetical protein